MSVNTSEDEIRILTAAFEKALMNKETRKKVENFLEHFSRIKRDQFLRRFSTLARYIDEFCGKRSSNVLFRILSQPIPDVTKSLEMISNDEVREWLRQLNAKYISVFEGVFPPLIHDWYRVLWTAKLDLSHGKIPLIEATILKRNGERAFFETPFASMVTLINHLLRQVCETEEVKLSEIPGMQEGLMQTKQILEKGLASWSSNS